MVMDACIAASAAKHGRTAAVREGGGARAQGRTQGAQHRGRLALERGQAQLREPGHLGRPGPQRGQQHTTCQGSCVFLTEVQQDIRKQIRRSDPAFMLKRGRGSRLRCWSSITVHDRVPDPGSPKPGLLLWLRGSSASWPPRRASSPPWPPPRSRAQGSPGGQPARRRRARRARPHLPRVVGPVRSGSCRARPKHQSQ